MLKIKYSSQFKTDFKLAVKRGLNQKKLTEVLTILVNGQVLPPNFQDHALHDSREYGNVRKCHIQGDWLLIYRIDKDTLILNLIRTGTHSNLF